MLRYDFFPVHSKFKFCLAIYRLIRLLEKQTDKACGLIFTVTFHF